MYAKDGAVEETLATVDAVCQFYDINPDLMVFEMLGVTCWNCE